MNWRSHTDRIISAVTKTFGDEMTFSPKGGTPVQINGVFDFEHEAVDPETQAIISVQQPVVTVRIADLPREPKRGDRFVIKSVSYDVRDVRPDGHGAALVLLNKNLYVGP